MSGKNDFDEEDFLEELLNVQSDEDSAEFQAENKVLEPLLDEVNLIIDQGVRLFTRAMLLAAPDHFWHTPSSKSGKYHPPDEHGEGGNVLHTKRVVRLVAHMSDAQEREFFERDIAISAAILHDITKYVRGKDGELYYDPFHPYTVENVYAEVHDSERAQDLDTIVKSTTLLCDETYLFEILRAIRCHLGPWSPIPETYPTSSLEWFIHLADSIAAKFHILIDAELVPQRWKI